MSYKKNYEIIDEFTVEAKIKILSQGDGEDLRYYIGVNGPVAGRGGKTIEDAIAERDAYYPLCAAVIKEWKKRKPINITLTEEERIGLLNALVTRNEVVKGIISNCSDEHNAARLEKTLEAIDSVYSKITKTLEGGDE